ncbi:MAG: hypothetical protein Q8Q25_01020, partial [bacterium]|nr:hypothetical protein [bacterium]
MKTLKINALLLATIVAVGSNVVIAGGEGTWSDWANSGYNTACNAAQSGLDSAKTAWNMIDIKQYNRPVYGSDIVKTGAAAATLYGVYRLGKGACRLGKSTWNKFHGTKAVKPAIKPVIVPAGVTVTVPALSRSASEQQIIAASEEIAAALEAQMAQEAQALLADASAQARALELLAQTQEELAKQAAERANAAQARALDLAQVARVATDSDEAAIAAANAAQEADTIRISAIEAQKAATVARAEANKAGSAVREIIATLEAGEAAEAEEAAEVADAVAETGANQESIDFQQAIMNSSAKKVVKAAGMGSRTKALVAHAWNTIRNHPYITALGAATLFGGGYDLYRYKNNNGSYALTGFNSAKSGVNRGINYFRTPATEPAATLAVTEPVATLVTTEPAATPVATESAATTSGD